MSSSTLSGLVTSFLVGGLGALFVRLGSQESPSMPMGHASHVHEAAHNEPHKTAADILVRVGNSRCPIMGGEVDPESLAVVEGIGIGICCPSCEEEIRKDLPGTLRKLKAEGSVSPGFEQWLGEHPEVLAEPPTEPPFRVGNLTCPIMEGEADPQTLVQVAGLAIAICCPACEDQIREDPAATVRVLLGQPKSGERLRQWLEDHPERRKALGFDAAEAPGETVTPAAKHLLTPLANAVCAVDGKPLGEAVVADIEGLQISVCTETCRSHLLENPERILERLAVDHDLRERIEAHRDLVARVGRGPHWHCAMCDLRSAAPGPCPICGMDLLPPDDATPYDLANTHCPIMGEKIEGDKATFVDHEGLRIHICCPSCERTFLQYPRYYLAKLEREQGVVVPKLVKEKP